VSGFASTLRDRESERERDVEGRQEGGREREALPQRLLDEWNAYRHCSGELCARVTERLYARDAACRVVK
jgi:hypothetical protein